MCSTQRRASSLRALGAFAGTSGVARRWQALQKNSGACSSRSHRANWNSSHLMESGRALALQNLRDACSARPAQFCRRPHKLGHRGTLLEKTEKERALWKSLLPLRIRDKNGHNLLGAAAEEHRRESFEIMCTLSFIEVAFTDGCGEGDEQDDRSPSRSSENVSGSQGRQMQIVGAPAKSITRW